MKGEKYLTKKEQYASVYNDGISWVNHLLVMKAKPNGLDLSRYGFSISKRVGNAVVRNRVKRLLREILRAAPLEPGRDIIFIARSPSAVAGYAKLKKSAESLLLKARLLVENYEIIRLEAN